MSGLEAALRGLTWLLELPAVIWPATYILIGLAVLIAALVRRET